MNTQKIVATKKSANDIEPAFPTHPGDVLKEEIEYRGISQRTLAAKMHVPYTQLNEILNAKRPLTPKFALLIEEILDLPAEPLLTMQMRYDVINTKRNSKFIEKLKKVKCEV